MNKHFGGELTLYNIYKHLVKQPSYKLLPIPSMARKI